MGLNPVSKNGQEKSSYPEKGLTAVSLNIPQLKSGF
jgi:hypothetical protein